MSVLCEAISVIIPISVLDTKYPGGMDAYRRACPNATFCADLHLTRVGFMVPDDVRRFVERLLAARLIHLQRRSALDLVVVDQLRGPTTPCEWLMAGRHPAGYSAAWLRLGMTGNLDTFLDFQTGREVYLGRTSPPRESQ
jgi:hypothetical protein